MKKLLTVIIALMMVATSLNAKTLIVYYSFTNNIRTVVNELSTQIEADVLEVLPTEENVDYAANNYAIGSALISAIRNNPNDASSYPAIKTTINNLADYNTVIIATPLWWSNMAAPMQTFLFTYGAQMAGKNIGLIVSSASSGISGVESDAQRLVPDGIFFSSSLWIRSSQVSSCSSMITDWLTSVNYNGITSSIDQITSVKSPNIFYRNGFVNVDGAFKVMRLYSLCGTNVLTTTESPVCTSNLTPGVYIAEVAGFGYNIVSKLRIAR